MDRRSDASRVGPHGNPLVVLIGGGERVANSNEGESDPLPRSCARVLGFATRLQGRCLTGPIECTTLCRGEEL